MATYQPYQSYSDTTGGGFDVNASRSGTSDSQTVSKPNTLLPVTIKQIMTSIQDVQDGPFISHGLELHSVSFVGVVRSVADYTTNVVVTIEDGTGEMEVKVWSSNASTDPNEESGSDEVENESAKTSPLAERFTVGEYVKCYGALKEFQNLRNIQYAIMKPIESFNEVIAHHLEAIKWQAKALGRFTSPEDDINIHDTANSAGQSLFVKDNDNVATNNSAGSPLDRIRKFIAEQCVNKDSNSFAVPVPLIVQTLNIDEETVRQCCNNLTDQGFIYPTFDENNFFSI